MFRTATIEKYFPTLAPFIKRARWASYKARTSARGSVTSFAKLAIFLRSIASLLCSGRMVYFRFKLGLLKEA